MKLVGWLTVLAVGGAIWTRRFLIYGTGIIGVAGVPDDLATWQVWFGKIPPWAYDLIALPLIVVGAIQVYRWIAAKQSNAVRTSSATDEEPAETIAARAALAKQERLREKQNDPRRYQPARDEPYDVTLRWALEHFKALGIEADDALDALRQAARNGTVTIYGRPDSGHQSPDNYYKPIEPIDPAYWRNFGFDVLRCIFHEDARQCRTEPDDTRNGNHSEAYVDLRVNSEQIKAKWPQRLSGFHATTLPPAQYSKAQIYKIVEAIDALYPPLLDIEQSMIEGTWVAGSMEAIIRDKGAQEQLDQMDRLRLKLIDPADRLDKELRKFSLYSEVCKILKDKQSHHDAFFASFNELADILRQIPDQMSAPALAIFVDAKKTTFITRTAEYLAWAQQKATALADAREWYLRRPTTD